MLELEGKTTAVFHLGIFSGEFQAVITAGFDATECFRLGLCPSDDPDTFSEALEHLDYLAIYDTFRQNFTIPVNESDYFYRMTASDRNHIVGSVDYTKTGVVLGVYLVVAMVILALYRNRRTLAIEYNFKLSTLSKMIFRYLVLKVVSTVVFFVFLFVFIREYFRASLLPSLTKFFVIWNYGLSVMSFSLVVLFALGYGTKQFTITTLMGLKTGILSVVYLIQTLKSLIDDLDQLNAYWDRDVTIYHKVSIGFLVVAVVITTLYFGYSTYKIDKDERFLKSASVILGAFLLNPFITLPEDSLSSIFVVKLVGATGGGSTAYGKHLPEVLELGVLIALVYIWRDIREEEEDVGLSNISLSEPGA